MASKRKSTTPCMIPSKIIRPADEVDPDSPLPLRQPRVSGGGRHSPLDPGESSKPEAGDAVRDGAGTYTCKPCNFETHDLNLFLDHVYSGHPDFRADPSFFCVSCGISAPKFEGLALHNARVHPSTLNTTLTLRKRDRRVVVEQNLVTGAETGKDSEISITKTPIMRMLKGKSESKRIVVSHPVSDEASSDPHSSSASRETERKEAAAVTVTHVPTIVHNGTTKVTLPSAIQIVNGSGALPMLKTPITQVVSVVQNRSLHQSAPITVSSNISSTSYSTSKNLPKVMIPLSSIPTYSASMDSSSFLKTSFSKFPYPTKAELCYLTVVTKFPEEQIKIWFTAQRLKQGISWSPEEIEEARRKMFNTIIQTAPSSSHNQTHSHHSPAQHTITVLPASLGAAGIPHILQGSLVSQGGVIVTQPVMANGIQVSSAPVALAVTPKPQAAARPMMQARPAAALVADKGVSMVVGTVGSSSTGSTIISSSNSSRSGRGGTSSITTSSQASVINLSLSNAKASSVNSKHSSANADCNNKSNSNLTSHANAKNAAKNNDFSRVVQSDSKVTTESRNSPDSVSNNSSSSKRDAQKSKESNSSSSKDQSTSTTSTDDVDPAPSDSPPIKMEDASSPASSSPSPAAAPGSRTPVNAFLDPSFYKGKKSQEQLSALKDSFQVSQFPDQEEVDRLIALTGLTVREVRKWFSDRRYHFRNLKGSRSSTGGPGKSGTASGAGSGSSTPGSGGNPVDLSDSSSGSNSGVKTPQHSSAPLSPTPSQTPTSPTTPSRRLPRPPSPDFTAIRYKEREPHQVKALEASFCQDPEPAGEEVDRLRSETKMTRREIHAWFAERRKRVAAEKKKEEVERAMREEEEEMEGDGEERQKEDASGELKVNPIKINLKMLKVTEANGKAEGEGLDSTPASSPSSTPKPPQSSTPTPKPSQSPKPTAIRGKKTAEQLQMLKQVYSRTQWPSAKQYDELISATGLSRPEVVRWFGDCRYVQKSGQLKWLESFQDMALEEDLQEGGAQILQAHHDAHSSLEESQLQELAEATGLTADLVRYWFSTKASLPRLEQTAAAAQETGPGPVAPDAAAEPQTAGSSPSEPQPGGGTEENMEQSVCGVATEEEEEANADKTVNPTKGTD
ncbi:zinc fingers and homeoboxes protein 3 [Centropristis striata]|uniref:zinc fingers and homeoboxes protein 3 n=1 Tax=Centropristis striata TaxID=184440 RepID=UPI0027E18464|nr:zinc fingers and homeoboxes protein 3 [Centropristis striata]XP_059189564.1 zinc fingers and homeoboxes protein 3 [Centropristis striata]XP_059189565.1 zinc fingers and homeoboxes protein 3 [Centropristis striata]